MFMFDYKLLFDKSYINVYDRLSNVILIGNNEWSISRKKYFMKK